MSTNRWKSSSQNVPYLTQAFINQLYYDEAAAAAAAASRAKKGVNIIKVFEKLN